MKNIITHVLPSLLVALISSTITVAQAAHYQVQEGIEYSHSILENRWDMSDQGDLFPLRWVDNLQSTELKDGVLSGVTKNNDPHLWLKFPQIPSSLTTLGQYQQAIDASRFTRLSFYMWLPEQVVPGMPEAKGRIVWHHGGETIPAFDAAYSESGLFPVYSGWHLYELDMETITVGAGSQWQGDIHGLRIDPCMGCDTFKVDWARLADANSAKIQLPENTSSHILLDDDQNSDNGFISVVPKMQDNHFSLAHLPAGQYQITPAPQDYALIARGNSWDMQESSDLYWGGVSGWENARIDNGMFRGVTKGADPFLMLDLPENKPIDASKYSHIFLEIYVSQKPQMEPGLLLYWGEQPVTFTSNTQFIALQPGWNTLQLDLSQYPTWTGEIRSLRIDPMGGGEDGVDVLIDHITLSDGTQATTLNQEHTVTINAAPKITLLDPHPYSGQDYASTVLGNAWDMNEWSDVPSTVNVQQESIGSSKYSAYSTATSASEGDPGAYILFQQNQAPLDADRFRLLSMTMEVPFDANQQDELTRGAVARVAWKKDDWDTGLTTDDILLYPGLTTYLIDMNQAVWEPTSLRKWEGAVRYLRIDPLEFPESRAFELDEVRVMSLPQYTSIMPLQYQLNDPEAGGMEVNVLIDSEQYHHITAKPTGLHTTWIDLSALQPGEHMLTLQVTDDAGNSHQTMLPVPFIKTQPTQQITNSEKLNYNNPAVGTVHISWQPRTEAESYRFYFGFKPNEMVGYINVNSAQSELNFTNIAAGHYAIALTRIDRQGEESAFIDSLEVDVE